MADKDSKKKSEKKQKESVEESKEIPINSDETHEEVTQEGSGEESKVEAQETPKSSEELNHEAKRAPVHSDFSRPAFAPPAHRRPMHPHHKVGKEPKASLPALVKIVAILYLILSIFSILFGIFLILGDVSEIKIMEDQGVSDYLTSLPGAESIDQIVLMTGVTTLIMGIIALIVGIGLLRRKNWARILAIILSVLTAISAVLSLNALPITSIIISLVINLFIVIYFLSSRRVRRAFR